MAFSISIWCHIKLTPERPATDDDDDDDYHGNDDDNMQLFTRSPATTPFYFFVKINSTARWWRMNKPAALLRSETFMANPAAENGTRFTTPGI